MTKKPLNEMIPELLEHFNVYKDNMEFNQRLYRMLGGQLRAEVEQSLKREIISESAYRRIVERIPPVNVLRRASDKLSKVYIEPPLRRTVNDTDQDILSRLVDVTKIDSVMVAANVFFNALKSFALEPYVDQKGHQRIRVLAPHQFLPYSDDSTDPSNVTVIMKMLGTEKKPAQAFNDSGQQVDKESIREVAIIALYSDTEFLIIDSGGRIRADKMSEMGVTSTRNPYGVLPFVYRSKSHTSLIPFPNQEGFDISVLIPKLLADLNYAAQFMSHSIIYTKNCDLNGQEINPDAVVNLGDSTVDGATPEIGTIEPRVDIPNVLSMIEFELQSYFDSIGIKANMDGAMANGRAASALAKALDESDVGAERKIQTDVFKNTEKELWATISKMQSVWAAANITKENRTFSPSFANDLSIVFGEMKPVKSTRQVIEETKMLLDMGLMSKKQALQAVYPQLTDEQTEKWLEEVEADKPPVLAQNSGQFGQDNQVAQNQEVDSKPVEVPEVE